MNRPFTSSQKLLNEEVQTIEQTLNYLTYIEAISRIIYNSIYIIDYYKRGFDYVSNNPLFLCGYTPSEIKEMGYLFYFKCVTEDDLVFLKNVHTIGLDFYEQLPMEERLLYTISCDFHIKNKEGNIILVNQKLTPISLTTEGRIWKAICVVSHSSRKKSGNIRVLKQGHGIVLYYDFINSSWSKKKEIYLSIREREVLTLSLRGFSISKISESLFISIDTVKFHRRKIFEKLEVSNMAEAILFATNNKLI